ncbi:cupin domain-containing protein [Lentisalinibacter sediminis]|uniref:cupin domain-containing protein n=1 Tax=Lentisalinibacter sediminis TaxID=2992237 RepID=UPI00386A9E37
MPKIDLEDTQASNATAYPAEYAGVVTGRWYKRLGQLSGLSDFAVSHVELEAGAWSAQRHWHEEEDEFVVVLSGSAVLVEDNGETILRAGDCAAFPKGRPDGHCLINRSDEPCTFIVVGQSVNGPCHYPDIDMRDFGAGDKRRKDGSSFQG